MSITDPDIVAFKRYLRGLEKQIVEVDQRVARVLMHGKVIKDGVRQQGDDWQVRLELGRDADDKPVESPWVTVQPLSSGALKIKVKPSEGQRYTLLSPSGVIGTGSQAIRSGERMSTAASLDLSRIGAPTLVDIDYEAALTARLRNFRFLWDAARAKDPTLPLFDVIDADGKANGKRVITLSFSTGTDVFRPNAVSPGLTAIDVVPRQMWDVGPPGRGWFIGRARKGRGIQPNRTDELAYLSIRLADGSRPEYGGRMRNRIGRTRIRRKPFTATVLAHLAGPPKHGFP
ncbi:hypothetical protein M9H71_24930, partial [Rhodopseudomonas parapalustris]